MLLALEDYTTELRTTAAKASPPEGIVVTGAESYETEIAIDEYIYPITKGEFQVGKQRISVAIMINLFS